MYSNFGFAALGPYYKTSHIARKVKSILHFVVRSVLYDENI